MIWLRFVISIVRINIAAESEVAQASACVLAMFRTAHRLKPVPLTFRNASCGFVFAFSLFKSAPLEILREALRTTARDARSGFVFCVSLTRAAQSPLRKTRLQRDATTE